MKKNDPLAFLNNAKKRPKVYKKLKVALAVGSVCFLILSGLLFWAGYSILNHGVKAIAQVQLSQDLEQDLSGFAQEFTEAQGVNLKSCFRHVQRHLDLQYVASLSVEFFLNSFKKECFNFQTQDSKVESLEDQTQPSENLI